MAQFRTTDLANPERKALRKVKPTKKCRRDKIRATKKAYYERNKAAISERARNRPDKSERNLRHHLKSYYGMSLADYMAREAQQCDRCAICMKHRDKLRRRLYVDHCHRTRKVRGLLCSRCNLLLGHARDCASLLRVAADYLEERYGSI